MYIADAWPNEDHSICVGFIHPQRCGCQEFLEMSTIEDKKSFTTESTEFTEKIKVNLCELCVLRSEFPLHYFRM